MHVDDPFGTEDLAIEAGYAVLLKLDNRQLVANAQPRDFFGGGRRFHVNDVGGANQIADPAAGTFCKIDRFDHFTQPAKLFNQPSTLFKAYPGNHLNANESPDRLAALTA
jgi:hypothetical protein